MDIKIKKLHPNAKMPYRANPNDAGADLVAASLEFKKDGRIVYGTGLAFEIPKGYVGLLVPRSSCSKMDIQMPNSVGVIDSDYRGEVKVIFRATMSNPITYNIGDRVAQLLIVPIELATFTEVGELSDTERGCGGFGSTGK